ncbi:MAG: hypothetical protein AUJ52_08565 [Elusimicrobia bacterium CG1_02_63_36]|nr:MAG: hypothetical protein AUJ52_08565 [Elusimicrobia bacterium CG1_02_63_36]PIP81831.1 MAG: hypothetical protein COR54_18120 [Elusimicrobia bacterium CG22_combo_CG10-13_8_21_14_all_63_91]PJA11508.1 MAG: hypothetical protein COX66_19670 [Elusimicrobia bacterium CG_4_10_14_0_2_um_filter_63_34]PJB24343.1 MAG: hypothetical protein CO113_14360 [Elusimicrobia bacterium CG_4_9_14_3_um_filter_62_55]
MQWNWNAVKAELAPRTLATSFVQGLFLLGPLAVTTYVLLLLLRALDKWIIAPVPGFGLLSAFVLVVLAGRFASNVFVRGAVEAAEGLMAKAPLIKLIYDSIRDLVLTFVGKRRRFDQPVLVSFGADSSTKLVGFITRKDLSFLGLPGSSAVYVPHAYNISGHVMLLPRERISALEGVSSAEMMTFTVSGGVTGGRAGPAAAAES